MGIHCLAGRKTLIVTRTLSDQVEFILARVSKSCRIKESSEFLKCIFLHGVQVCIMTTLLQSCTTETNESV